MTFTEKLLYHQIHPLKLATDISTSVGSCIVIWQHQFVSGMLLAFVPAILATVLVIARADLEAAKTSAFGRYVRLNMSRPVEAQRMTGQVVMWVGAWQHELLTVALGILVIVLAWLSGLGRPSLGALH